MAAPGVYALLFKPAIDRLGALSGLIVLSPVIGVVFVLARIKLGKPVFFHQTRTGKQGEFFNLVKFRSMTGARDADGNLLEDAARLTAFGQFLRSSSLDELPQLWNVLRGDMSLVGPRPLLPVYLPRYTPYQRQRHDVKPGITGLAQVSGRNAISWEEKFELDVHYSKNVTALMDAKILGLTLLRVLGRKDVSREGHVTSPEFLGTSQPGTSGQSHESCT